MRVEVSFTQPCDEVERHPALARRDAVDVVEDGGLDHLDQLPRLHGGARIIGAGGGAGVLRPQVPSEVVALGDEVLPAVAVEAPARVEQLVQPPGDARLRLFRRVARLRDERVGELAHREGVLRAVDPLGERHEVVGLARVARRPRRLRREAVDQAAGLRERLEEPLGAGVPVRDELSQVRRHPRVAVLRRPGVEGLDQLGP